jgi:hypothetical protein
VRAGKTKILTAAFLAATAAVASAADRAVYRNGNIEVVLVTKPLPKEFSGEEADPDWPWFGVRTVVTRISVTVGETHAVLPARAYLGMTDPGAVEIKQLPRKGSWMLTVTGGDGSTSHRTVMEFRNENVRLVKEYELEADAEHPYVTETFSAPRSLN